ncbi:hypothetical protein V6N13_063223 [Hibiscus sabdariffa]|uniref:Uncharacterized protein n=2 Tax=Hibiscus sabdariffa TaxID=183260 RepID=A0ABR2C4I1_9ROSI
MEALLSNYVEKSLDQYMLRNAVFLCERLFAQFPSEVNLQLLARCYLAKNQPYSAYYILKGMEMAQSRYLFAIACLEMDLFSEAEAALLPIEHLCSEVPNGAAVQYLLGTIYRDTARMKRSVEHFRKALSIDPLFWAAYEELCMLGEAEESSVYFGDAAIPCVQEHCLGNTSSCMLIAGTNHSFGSSQRFGFEDLSLSHLQQKEGKKLRDICQNNHGGPVFTGAVEQITNSCCNTSSLSTPSPVPTQRSGEALEMTEKAIVMNNKNPLPKYSKAKLLVTLGKLNEALEILEELKECTPHESSIYALMGEIYKQHKKYDKAMLHFGLALDLKPSLVDVAKIKRINHLLPFRRVYRGRRTLTDQISIECGNLFLAKLVIYDAGCHWEVNYTRGNRGQLVGNVSRKTCSAKPLDFLCFVVVHSKKSIEFQRTSPDELEALSSPRPE